MIEKINTNQHHNQFLNAIVQSIQIDIDEFTNRVENNECYETMIYRWSIKLFEKGISINLAIRIIHRARRYVLLYQTKNDESSTFGLTPERILALLIENQKYNGLNNKKKQLVQKRTMELFHKNEQTNIIEEILATINTDIALEPKRNKESFIPNSQNRIMEFIRNNLLLIYKKH